MSTYPSYANHDTRKLIYKMLTESTGAALCDSGDAYGRGWERNQKRSFNDFMRDSEVTCEIGEYGYEYTISVFHYLSNYLELDELCNKYNRLVCKDWDSEIYGVSTKQEAWLSKHGLEAGDCINTYNHDSNLSQILQYTYMPYNNGEVGTDYILVQIHNGCDARGGYTDAKLFKLSNLDGYMPGENVYGTWSHDGKDTRISNTYDGARLTIDDDTDNQDTEITPKVGDTIELELMEY